MNSLRTIKKLTVKLHQGSCLKSLVVMEDHISYVQYEVMKITSITFTLILMNCGNNHSRKFLTMQCHSLGTKPFHLGHNPMKTFMGNLSQICQLLDYYTNHCIRITGTTKLTRENYTLRQIMSITGHKSIQSLGIYQCVKADEKLMMGMGLPTVYYDHTK